ncbi:MAG TPA: aminotransferase class I/II-fold pyridoxal phosphate-dependent enzyme, partial [Candidatus Saccharimonadales bacterium]|nr:aminotransferase class I/II-fold pyridoxal phosphate-dependent enzyme [Candidatus Saccharimonadales bacterium]
MGRPIAISLSPNTQTSDILLALKTLLAPWNYYKGNYATALEQWFVKNFKVASAVSFNSGRSSLFAILKALDIQKGDEILMQTFTCVAVPNAIIWAGAKPVYVDIDKTLTMDAKDLERKITAKTKAILVQHTFGIPSNMDEIRTLARKNKLIVIEDCAHTIGAVYNGKKLGTLSDVAFFSLGRDKAFSSVFGGMAITNNRTLGNKLKSIQKKKNNPNVFWVFQQLLHPVAV